MKTRESLWLWCHGWRNIGNGCWDRGNVWISDEDGQWYRHHIFGGVLELGPYPTAVLAAKGMKGMKGK